MAITSNVSGALKMLKKITANVNGTLKELNTVHTSAGGVLKLIHSSKPSTITGTASCNTSYVSVNVGTNITLTDTYTVTFKATIEETPTWNKGTRAFKAINSVNGSIEFDVTTTSDTDMTATAVLPAGVYTFQMMVFNVHGDRYGTYYTYPTVTYTITFS